MFSQKIHIPAEMDRTLKKQTQRYLKISKFPENEQN
jgi:hypothetical protein